MEIILLLAIPAIIIGTMLYATLTGANKQQERETLCLLKAIAYATLSIFAIAYAYKILETPKTFTEHFSIDKGKAK
jgi:hypothetical protein